MSSMFDFCVDTYADIQGIYHTKDWKDPDVPSCLKSVKSMCCLIATFQNVSFGIFGIELSSGTMRWFCELTEPF